MITKASEFCKAALISLPSVLGPVCGASNTAFSWGFLSAIVGVEEVEEVSVNCKVLYKMYGVTLFH